MRRAWIPLLAATLIGCGAIRTLTREQVERVPRVVKGRYIPVDIGAAAPLEVRVVDENPDASSTIVLLHGLASSVETWDGWAEALKKNHRVIRLDLPGSGLTGARPDRNYSVAADAAVVQAVIDTLRVREFSLAGNSLGGYVAWYLAAEPAMASRVKNLILVSPIGLRAKPGVADNLSASVRALTRVVTFRRLLRKEEHRCVSDRMLDAYWALARFDGNRGAVADRLSRPWCDYTSLLTLIRARTLILWGAEDQYLLHPEDACVFLHRIPNAQLLVLPGIGHTGMEQDPVTTAGIAAEFIDGKDLTLPPGTRQNCSMPTPGPPAAKSRHTHDGPALPLPKLDSRFSNVYVIGTSGPPILLLHEAPGLSYNTFRLAQDIAAKGYVVYVPLLFGNPGESNTKNIVLGFFDPRWMVFRDSAPPIVRSLQKLTEEISGGRPMGVIGMCLTGGSAISLASRVSSVKAIVVAQPALPYVRPGALGLDRRDIEYVNTLPPRSILFFRFSHDTISPCVRENTYRDDFDGAIDFDIIDSSPGNPSGTTPDAHAVLTSMYDHDGNMIPSRRDTFKRLMDYLDQHLR